jgi:ABC-2 type transport system ATP-binding protein
MSIVYNIQGITKTYPDQPQPANKGISLQIREGEIFGFLGDNGAGKSTLVKQMVNLLTSDSGSTILFGQAVDVDPLYAALHEGYMPQSGAALNSLTVGEALYFTAYLRGMSRSDAQTERERLLALWDLEEIRNKPPDKLSGGQKRLLQLAVAMAGTPPVLILDEPTNDLAPQRRKRVWEVLHYADES